MTGRTATGPSRVHRARLAFALLGVGVAGFAALNLAMGAVAVPPADVVTIVARKLGWAIGDEPTFQASAVVWNIRVPRTITGVAVGAGLGAAGAALQGLFRNPLADGQLLGLGPGASLGAVFVLAGLAGGSEASLAGGAAGGIITALVVRRLDARGGGDPLRTVVVGIALGAALSAWVGFAVFALDRGSVPPVEFWLLGSLTGSTGPVAVRTAVITIIGIAVLVGSAGSLDVMALGRSDAEHLGVDTRMVSAVVLIATGAVVGVTVGAAGVVGFVGLVSPHIARRVVGPRNRPVLAASALIGAILVSAADLVARTIASPIEIPVGLVTASVGGPFFVWLLQRTRHAAS